MSNVLHCLKLGENECHDVRGTHQHAQFQPEAHANLKTQQKTTSRLTSGSLKTAHFLSDGDGVRQIPRQALGPEA